MTSGHDYISYGGYLFLTEVEARWAVFFDALNDPDPWDYEPLGYDLRNPQHYRPQFSLPRLKGYLEVRPDDNSARRPLPQCYPEIEEHAIYRAVGDFPDKQQLGATGWWDPMRRQGVRELTRCFEWEMWFPPNYPDVLQAVEVAGAQELKRGIPSARQPDEEVRDIPEREREQRPE